MLWGWWKSEAEKAREVEQCLCIHLTWTLDDEGAERCVICGLERPAVAIGMAAGRWSRVTLSVKLGNPNPWYIRLWGILTLFPRYLITGEFRLP